MDASKLYPWLNYLNHRVVRHDFRLEDDDVKKLAEVLTVLVNDAKKIEENYKSLGKVGEMRCA